MKDEAFSRLFILSKKHQELIGSHGYEHTERVIELCKFLGGKLNADMDVLIPAAILHDISRSKYKHAESGAIESKDILLNLGFDEQRVLQICEAISTHSFSGGGEILSLEAKILSDADKLDALGAIGIYRTAMYSCENLRPLTEFIAHFHEKLFKLKDMMYTDEARKIAEIRHEFMKKYLDRFLKELEFKV